MTTFNIETLPIPVILAPGQSISLTALLSEEFGAAAADIAKLSVAYFGKGALGVYSPPLRYWTSVVGTPDGKNAADVMTMWKKDDVAIGATGFHQNTTDWYPTIPPTDNNVDHVTSATMDDYSLVAGSNIAPFAFLTIPAAYNAQGVATVYDQYSITIENSGVFAGPATPGKPKPSDIVAAAEAYAAYYPDVPNDNDCCFIAQDIAAAAGAALDDPTQSIIPQDNVSQGFWRVVYRGSDPNPVQDWSSLVEPGDIVRLGWSTGGEHTTTVLAKAATPNADGTYTLTVYDNIDYNANGNETIGIHQDVFDDDLTYDASSNPADVTIYRLADDDMYLITGNAASQALYGNIYDDKMIGGAGDDKFYSGGGADNEIVGAGGIDTFVATQLTAAEVSFSVGDSVVTLKAAGVDDTLTGITYVELGDAAVLIHGGATQEIAGHGHAEILFANAAGALSSWETTGAAVSGGGAIGSPGAAWTLAGASAANAVDAQDLFFVNAADDELAFWQVFGSTVVASYTLGAPGGSWKVVAVGDFNGDGDDDVLLRDDSGDLAVWDIVGGALAGGGTIGNLGKGWTFLGTGDFAGGGATDLLFESAAGVLATWTISGAKITGGATLGSTSWVYKATGDFTGDGASDILFENVATGAYEAWTVEDDAVTGLVDFGAPGPDFAFKGVADLSGDGESDILFQNVLTGQYWTWDVSGGKVVGGGNLGAPGGSWSLVGAPPAVAPELPAEIFFQNASGAVAAWDVADSVLSGGATFGNPGSAWTMLGAGDFYGDNEPDILFENASGTYALWRTDGQALVAGGGNLGAPGGSWAFKAIGDFNGDGASDILLENASGDYAAWDFNGLTSLGLTSIGDPGAGWTFKAAADFNGDGTNDLLFENASGEYAVWLIGDNRTVGGGEVGDPGAGWTFMGAGDFNGAGKASLLFENAAGVYATWDLSGNSIVGGGTVGDPGANWQFEGIADLNGNHQSSILFHNTSTDQYATWLLNDAKIAGGGMLGAPGAGWSFKTVV